MSAGASNQASGGPGPVLGAANCKAMRTDSSISPGGVAGRMTWAVPASVANSASLASSGWTTRITRSTRLGATRPARAR